MTVIAYRSGVLAADRVMTDRGTILGMMTKINRGPGGVLWGSAGSCGVGEQFDAWVRGGRRGPLIVHTSADTVTDDDLDVLLIEPNGVIKSNEGLRLYTLPVEFVAIGAGADFALAAMKAGASAERACEIACELCTLCRGPVDTLELKPSRR